MLVKEAFGVKQTWFEETSWLPLTTGIWKECSDFLLHAYSGLQLWFEICLIEMRNELDSDNGLSFVRCQAFILP